MTAYDDSVLQRFWRYVEKTETCWLWTGGTNGYGYGRLWVRGHFVGTHRVSFSMHVGPIPDGLCVLHTCDVPACIRPDHLFLGTHRDNMHDMVQKKRHWPYTHPDCLAKGDRNGSRTHPERVRRGDNHPFHINPELSVRGTKHGLAKLTDELVHEIRRRYYASEAKRGIGRQLAREFHVCPQSISNVVRGITWTHVHDD